MRKIEYFQFEYLKILSSIEPTIKPVFGKMNVHQMIEHMSYAFRQASGLMPSSAINDEETTQKMFQFMMSDKPFRDNTPNPYLPNEPAPAVCPTIQESISVLEKDIQTFFSTFENDHENRILNPFFGNLNFEEWTHLLHKHAQHHLRQFNQL
jgi:hypothetical protein